MRARVTSFPSLSDVYVDLERQGSFDRQRQTAWCVQNPKERTVIATFYDESGCRGALFVSLRIPAFICCPEVSGLPLHCINTYGLS